MNTGFFLQTFLLFHLLGLVLMAGTTVIDSIMYRTIWKQFEQNRQEAVTLLQATSGLGRISGIGAALLVFSGIGMMALTHGVFGEQLWFRIKFGLVVILIANNLIARRRGIKLRKSVAVTDGASFLFVENSRAFLGRYFTIQYAVFLLIILLSVFKFN